MNTWHKTYNYCPGAAPLTSPTGATLGHLLFKDSLSDVVDVVTVWWPQTQPDSLHYNHIWNHAVMYYSEFFSRTTNMQKRTASKQIFEIIVQHM